MSQNVSREKGHNVFNKLRGGKNQQGLIVRTKATLFSRIGVIRPGELILYHGQTATAFDGWEKLPVTQESPSERASKPVSHRSMSRKAREKNDNASRKSVSA